MRYQGQELYLKALAFCYWLLFLKLSQSDSSYTDPNSTTGQPGSQRRQGEATVTKFWAVCALYFILSLHNKQQLQLLVARCNLVLHINFRNHYFLNYKSVSVQVKTKPKQLLQAAPDQVTTVQLAVGVRWAVSLSRCRTVLCPAWPSGSVVLHKPFGRWVNSASLL